MGTLLARSAWECSRRPGLCLCASASCGPQGAFQSAGLMSCSLASLEVWACCVCVCVCVCVCACVWVGG